MPLVNKELASKIWAHNIDQDERLEIERFCVQGRLGDIQTVLPEEIEDSVDRRILDMFGKKDLGEITELIKSVDYDNNDRPQRLLMQHFETRLIMNQYMRSFCIEECKYISKNENGDEIQDVYVRHNLQQVFEFIDRFSNIIVTQKKISNTDKCGFQVELRNVKTSIGNYFLSYLTGLELARELFNLFKYNANITLIQYLFEEMRQGSKLHTLVREYKPIRTELVSCDQRSQQYQQQCCKVLECDAEMYRKHEEKVLSQSIYLGLIHAGQQITKLIGIVAYVDNNSKEINLINEEFKGMINEQIIPLLN